MSAGGRSRRRSSGSGGSEPPSRALTPAPLPTPPTLPHRGRGKNFSSWDCRSPSSPGEGGWEGSGEEGRGDEGLPPRHQVDFHQPPLGERHHLYRGAGGAVVPHGLGVEL